MARTKAPAASPVVEASPGSPAAALTVRPGLRVRPQRPARAFVGALVVVAAVVAALALYSRIGDRREVLMVTRTVLAGEQLSDSDLRVVSVGSDADFAGVSAADREAVVGQFARVRLASNSLLVGDQLQPTRLVSEGRVLASVTVPLGEVPVGLREQSQVALVVTPGDEVAEEAGAAPVVVPATVTALPANLAEVVGDVDSSSRTVVPLSVEVPAGFARLVGSAKEVSVVVVDPAESFPAELTTDPSPQPPVSAPAAEPSTTVARSTGAPTTTAVGGGG